MIGRLVCSVCKVVYLVHNFESSIKKLRCPHGHVLGYYRSRLDYDKSHQSVNESELIPGKEA